MSYPPEAMREDLTTLSRENAALRARVTALREALEEYGEHCEDCAFAANIVYPCTCGLSRALEDDK